MTAPRRSRWRAWGVTTGLVPLIELEYGEVTGRMPIRRIRPVADYLRAQERFRHLFADTPQANEERAHLQAIAEANVARWELGGGSPDPHDTEGADTVRRGGAHWA